MVTINQQKCACPDCVCIVELKSAIEKDGRHYCSDSCASGHKDGNGCDHGGCDCKG